MSRHLNFITMTNKILGIELHGKQEAHKTLCTFIRSYFCYCQLLKLSINLSQNPWVCLGAVQQIMLCIFFFFFSMFNSENHGSKSKFQLYLKACAPRLIFSQPLYMSSKTLPLISWMLSFLWWYLESKYLCQKLPFKFCSLKCCCMWRDG